MTTKIFDYTTPSEYTYDSDLIEISGGVAKLKDVRPTDSTCAGMWLDSDLDLSWGEGTLTGTGTGSPVVTSGKLDLRDTGVIQYADYSAVGNCDSQQVGCVRLDVTPNYSGTPSGTMNYFTISQATTLHNNIVALYHFTNGARYIAVSDENAVSLIFVAIGGVWAPTAGTTYTFELNWDITNGATRLFMDGTQVGATQTATGTRSSSIGLLRFGAYTSVGASISDFQIDNFVAFDTVQHTTDHTGELPFDPPYKYSNAAPTVLTEKFYSSNITAFSDSFTQENGDTVKETIVVDDSDFYVTGGAVAASNGTYAQSSVSADINTYAEDFLSTRAGVNVKSFLYSDGATTPELTSTTVTYREALSPPTEPTAYSLQGFLTNITESSWAANTVVQIRPYLRGYPNEGVFQIYEYETIATTDANGWFDADVYLNPDTANLYEIKIGSSLSSQSYYFDISDATGTIDLSDLTLTLVEL